MRDELGDNAEIWLVDADAHDEDQVRVAGLGQDLHFLDELFGFFWGRRVLDFELFYGHFGPAPLA